MCVACGKKVGGRSLSLPCRNPLGEAIQQQKQCTIRIWSFCNYLLPRLLSLMFSLADLASKGVEDTSGKKERRKRRGDRVLCPAGPFLPLRIQRPVVILSKCGGESGCGSRRTHVPTKGPATENCTPLRGTNHICAILNILSIESNI